MRVNTSFISQCVSIGGTLHDRILLALFGLVAPPEDRPPTRWRRLLKFMIPQLWLKPRQLNGLKLSIDPTDWSQTVIFEEVFLQSNYDLNRINFIPDMIFDCGAHIGLFSLLVKGKFPHVRLTAYEPSLRNSQLLRRQIAGNNLDVTLVEAAVSIEAGEVNFVEYNSHSGKLLHDKTAAGGRKVAVINFPEVVRQLNPSSVLLKMDVEGEERCILPILVPLLPHQSAVFFETHSGEAGWQEIEALLVSNGFRVEQVNARQEFYDGFAWRG